MPPVFADAPLARRLETTEGHGNAAFIDAQARHEPYSGAIRSDVAGTMLMFAGVGSPITQSFCLGIQQRPTDRDFDGIERFFTSRGSPVFHEVCPHAGVETLAALATRGYKPIELSNVMYREIAGEAGEAGEASDTGATGATGAAGAAGAAGATGAAGAAGATCATGATGAAGATGATGALRVRVVDTSEANWYGGLAARGWSETPDVQQFIQGFARSSVEVATCFIAELDGNAIATAALFMHGGVALLAGASTVPEGRRNGAQLALLDTRLRHAASHGCDLAMMVAAPGSASQRNAERNGFRVAYTRTKWQL